MYLILNERKYAEYILNTGDLGTNVSTPLFVLAKYYSQVKGMKKKAIIESLDQIMSVAYPGYIKDNWTAMLEKAAKQATKYPLIEIDSIPVTQKELDAINQLNYQSEKKLAFTLLVIAKFFNITHSNNNNWVNCEPQTIFKYANVNEGQINQAKMYSVLTKAGIIMYSQKTGSVNAQVLIVDNDGDPVENITDLRNLGHEYMRYYGANYTHCSRCNVLFKQAKSKPRSMCESCMSNSVSLMRKFICEDCGKEVFVAGTNRRSNRCPDCQLAVRRMQVKANNARRSQNNDYNLNENNIIV